MKKLKPACSVHSSTAQVLVFESTMVPRCLTMALQSSFLITQSSKQTRTQGLSFHKISNCFSTLSRIFLSETAFFFSSNCKHMAVKNTKTPSMFWGHWLGLTIAFALSVKRANNNAGGFDLTASPQRVSGFQWVHVSKIPVWLHFHASPLKMGN